MPRQISLEEVARYPRPGAAAPSSFAFSPDGALLTYLHAPGSGLRRELWALDLSTGERRALLGAGPEEISREEALRRERLRIRDTGITRYEWAAEAPALLTPVGREVLVFRDGVWRMAAENAAAPRLSPDGTLVGFVRDGDLYVAPSHGRRERRLTSSAAPGLTNGLAEYVAQEEMGRAGGFWISPDSRRVAFVECDERQVPIFRIPHFARGPHDSEEHRYPFAGERNVRIRLGIVPVAGGEPRWLDLSGAEYLARAQWGADGRLWVQLQDRAQRRLELRTYDAEEGSFRTVLSENSPHWVNLHRDLRILEDGGYVWSTEAAGSKQLWLHRPEGDPLLLSDGVGAVDELLAVTPGHVWFTGWKESPSERHVWRAPRGGGPPERMSEGPGMHGAAVSPDGSLWVHLSESRTLPPRVSLRGPRQETLHEPPRVAMPGPEISTFRAADSTELLAAVYRPEGRGPFPVAVAVYGGPRHQAVQDSWALTVDMRAQYLASRGILVLKVDNRGSSRRGADFEAAVKGRLGNLEVADQAEGVRWVMSQGLGDAERVAIYGWSYGGYMVLRCMALHPELFRAGVAGAPVTEWEGYDTHYTERYMGAPAENPDGYRDASAVAVAGRIRGRLLLVHGMLDENVHFRHTARMVDALQKAGIDHELLLLPDERHMPRDARGLLALETRICSFLQSALLP